MPSPAESLRNRNESCVASERTTGLTFTAFSVSSPKRGGWEGIIGPWNGLPAPVEVAILFRPIQDRPGIHPQPVPGQNDQSPEW